MTKSLLLSLSTILLMGVVILTGCTSHTAEESPSSVPTVRVVRIQKESFQPSLKTFGTLTYMRKADVFSPQEGTIETLRAEEGDRVSKGQVLATLSRENFLLPANRRLQLWHAGWLSRIWQRKNCPRDTDLWRPGF